MKLAKKKNIIDRINEKKDNKKWYLILTKFTPTPL